MKKIYILALCTTIFSGWGALAESGCDADESIIKFSHVTNTDKHPKGIAATMLAERINTEMNGKLCMEVYPDSTLYDDDAVLEAMLQGDVQMAAPSLSKFEQYTLAYQIFDLPFMFKNADAVDAFQKSEKGEALLHVMENRGFVGLGFWHNGLTQFSANKPLLMPSDAAGLKFRVQPSDVLVAQMEALSASAQPMAFSEVYGALQQGVVDGQENTWSNIYGQKLYEVQDGITESNHGVLDYLVVVPIEWLEGLEPDTRDQFLKIFGEVTADRNAASVALNEENRKAIADTGEEIRTLTDEQRAAWVTTMKPVWGKFTSNVGQDTIDYIQDLNAQN